jgi:hypothetical protein
MKQPAHSNLLDVRWDSNMNCFWKKNSLTWKNNFFLEILVNLATLELFLYNIKMPFFLEGKKVMLRSTFARVKQFCTKLTFILPGKLIQNSKFGIACKLKSEMEIP